MEKRKSIEEIHGNSGIISPPCTPLASPPPIYASHDVNLPDLTRIAKGHLSERGRGHLSEREERWIG